MSFVLPPAGCPRSRPVAHRALAAATGTAALRHRLAMALPQLVVTLPVKRHVRSQHSTICEQKGAPIAGGRHGIAQRASLRLHADGALEAHAKHQRHQPQPNSCKRQHWRAVRGPKSLRGAVLAALDTTAWWQAGRGRCEQQFFNSWCTTDFFVACFTSYFNVNSSTK